MKFEKPLIIASLLISILALILSVKTLKRDPLGTNISKYDLSSPENTLKSINKMVANKDLKAGWQFFEIPLQNDSSPETKLYFSDNVNVKVLKSVELSKSFNPKNNGLIVSFVNIKISGIDYNIVQYFKKDQLNRFYLSEKSYVEFGKESEQDKEIDTAVKEFEKTGKIL